MTKRSKIIAIGATALALAGAGAGVAVATGGDDDASDTPITGSALDEASAAALDHLGGGTVSETEVGDEESYYEIEVTNPDGSQTDVQLDRKFNVVGDETDGAGEDEAGE